MINWKTITGAMSNYRYTGDVNPWEYGGAWIDASSGHVVRINGLDCGLTDDKGRDVCVVESLQLWVTGTKRIREALSVIGVTVADWLHMPKDEARFTLACAALAYGFYDPANEYPAHHTVTTHREPAAFRAINTYLR